MLASNLEKFNRTLLEEITENKFKGVLWCQERSPRKWRISLVAEIEDDKVKWNANELKWYSFNYPLNN